MKDKEIFVKMCSEIKFSSEFYYPEMSVLHDDNFNEITSYENYPILVEKIKKLVYLINKNPNYYNMDI